MEIKFQTTAVPYLRSLTEQVQTREETQELRLTEGMPDIGRILGCWGQIVIRSKEWRSGGMSISGGVTVWVLYAPEEGGAPQKVESWVPFQQKWDFDDEGRDGFIWVQPALRSLDARSVSPRKIMVRANISTLGRALQNTQTEIFQPEGLPEDVQLLKEVYPMMLPVESGEKPVPLDEMLPGETAQSILNYSMTPKISEWKILGSRLVFKGVCGIHLLCDNGERLQTRDLEVPFSQFADLDRDHSPAAEVMMAPVVTDMELAQEEGGLHLTASVAVQFGIFDRTNVELVGDAYSPLREVTPQHTMLQLPAQLDRWNGAAEPTMTIPGYMGSLVDCYPLMEIPQSRGRDVQVSGSCQVLYYDPAGQLQGGSGRFEQNIPMDQSADADVQCMAWAWDQPAASGSAEGIQVALPLEMEFSATAREGIPMVSGLELGQLREPDGMRPSLILCRCGNQNLWDLAKACGSTVASIREANALDAEPEPERMLLIPIA